MQAIVNAKGGSMNPGIAPWATPPTKQMHQMPPQMMSQMIAQIAPTPRKIVQHPVKIAKSRPQKGSDEAKAMMAKVRESSKAKKGK